MSRLAWLALLASVAGAALGEWLNTPPRVEPRSAPPQVVSGERALEDVRAMAREPHPIGSPEHRRVQEWVAQRLAPLGGKLQRGTVKLEGGAQREVANVLARWDGEPGRPTVVLAAHYDSTPNGPGAGDDASGCAAIFEALRALAAEPGWKPRNPITVLITDGEESGLLGAYFAVRSKDPWLSDVGVVLNFEARGGGGASYLFETTRDSGWLIREAASAMRTPRTNSLAAAIYREMPNDTDLTIFRRAGWQGLNFAFIDRFEAYHTPLDSAELLDVRSLQHQADYCYHLTKRFCGIDLRPEPGERIWFNAGNFVVHYPLSWGWPLGGAVAAAVAAAAAWAWRRGRATVGALAGGFVASIAVVGVGGFGGWLGSLALASGSDEGEFLLGRGGGVVTAAAALGALLLAGTFAVGLKLTRWLRPDAAWSGMALLWTLLLGATLWALPGGSFLWQLPAAAAAAAVFIGNTAARITAVAAISMLFAPLVHTAVVALQAPALVAAGVFAAMVGLLAGAASSPANVAGLRQVEK